LLALYIAGYLSVIRFFLSDFLAYAQKSDTPLPLRGVGLKKTYDGAGLISKLKLFESKRKKKKKSLIRKNLKM